VTRFVAVSALKCQQSGASNRRIGVGIKSHKVSSIGLSGVSTNFTEWLFIVIVIGNNSGHFLVAKFRGLNFNLMRIVFNI
jgi:hypothetical protein